MKKEIVISLGVGAFILGVAPTAMAELAPIEELGKLIFFDENLSTPPGQACAACHDPMTAFAGPVSELNERGGVYPGAVHVRFGNRKPPSAAYASFSPDFYYDEDEGLYVGGSFWDGRALNLVEQAKGPFLNPVEQNNPNARHVVRKIARSDYAVLFQEVFGGGSLMDEETAYQQVAEAIAAYEASSDVNRFSSKYDAYLAGDTMLSEQEMRGLMLFEGQAMCSACHPSQPGEDGTPPLFTDFTYDNLGTPRNPENPWYEMPPSFNPDGGDWIDYGLGGRLGLEEEMGKFKVPTLRNVAMRPYEGFVQAYTHNGFFKSLHDVVDFYNTRDVADWPEPEVAENVNDDELGDLGLSDQDVDDIVAFLGTLTDGWMPAPLRPAPRAAGFSAHPDYGQVGPNPFTTTTNIRFVLPEESEVRLEIFDATGRQVRVLEDGRSLVAGGYEWIWDGRDARGIDVPAGAYLYRLRSSGLLETGRLVRVR